MHNVLIIGVGSIGERHTRCFLNTGRVKVSICEVNDELRNTIADRYDIETTYDDLDAAMEASFDLAVICVPAHLHIRMALQLAKAGVPLLIEKPLGTGLEGIGQLRQTVMHQKLFAAVAYTYRAHPLLVAVRDAIEGGDFGRPLTVQFIGGQHFPTFRPAYREIYYAKRETGGGCIQDAITHMINAGEWVCGPVRRLVCDAEHIALPDVKVEDMAHVLTRQQYKGKAGAGEVNGVYSCTQYQAKNELVLTVICENGCVRADFTDGAWLTCTDTQGPWVEQGRVELERDTLYVNQANATLDALESGGAPLCSLDEGLQTLRCNLAEIESAREQAWKAIDAQV